MAKVVWKHRIPISDYDYEISWPEGSRVLRAEVALDSGGQDILLWAEHPAPTGPTNNPLLTVSVVGTGMHFADEYQVIATAPSQDQRLVWHVITAG